MDYNITPYYDDYFATNGGLDKNYYKVLFRPGRALQARELTTAQTILQNQINVFGKHFFPDGADVYGAEKTIESHTYVKLTPTESVDSTFVDFTVGDTLYDTTNQINGVVVSACPSSVGESEGVGEDDPDTIWVKYLNANTEVNSWSAGDELYKNGVKVATIESSSDAVGKAEGVTVNTGIVFTKESFVVSETESIIVRKYDESSYSRIGYIVKEELAGAVDDVNIDVVDSTLCDNAQGYPNYTAPGADRTKITLHLASFDASDTIEIPAWIQNKVYGKNSKVIHNGKVYVCIQRNTSSAISEPGTNSSEQNGYQYWGSIDDFIEIGRIKDSSWIKGSKKIGFSQETYDAVLDVIYKREALTEGNFNVDPHDISIEDNVTADILLADYTRTVVDNDKLLVSVGPGKSVVSGREVVNSESKRFNIDKARTESHIKESINTTVDTTHGNYMLVTNLSGWFDVDRNEIITFKDAEENEVARANIKHFSVNPEELKDTPENYRLYFYNYHSIAPGNTVSVHGVDGSANSVVTTEGRAVYTEDGELESAVKEIYGKVFSSKNKKLVFPVSSENIRQFKNRNTNEVPVAYQVQTFTGRLQQSGGIMSLRKSDEDSAFFEPDEITKFINPANKLDIANENYVLINNSGETISITTGDTPTNVDHGEAFPLTAICGETESTFEVTEDGRLLIEFPSDNTYGDYAVKIQIKTGLLEVTPDTKTYAPCSVAYVLNVENDGKQGYNSSIINFFEPDVIDVLAVYEANSGEDPTLPTVTLDSTINYLNGETVKEIVTASGNETGKRGIIIKETTTSGTWEFIPTDGKESETFFTTDGTTSLVGETSGTTNVINGYEMNDAVRDITSRYTLLNGKKDNFYDWASLELNSGYQSASRPITIVYNKFVISDNRSGLFAINSYGDFVNNDFVSHTTSGSITLDYSELPEEAHQLDFRPSRINLNLTDDLSQGYKDYVTTYGGVTWFPETDNILNVSPFADFPAIVDYEYFVGRTDYAVIDKETNFKIVSGIPGGNEPTLPEGAMLLWKIYVPPYTPEISLVKTSFVENKLYQQNDIAKLEERIKNLESFAKITDDELKALSKPEPSISDLYFGLERFKNGILLDTFTGFDRTDLLDGDIRCAIDPEKQTVRSPFNTTLIDVDVPSNSTKIKYHSNYDDSNADGKKSGVITADYTTTSFINQPKISTILNVNPYNVFSFIGRLTLTPSSDSWYDTVTLPDIIVQSPENETFLKLEKSINEKLVIKVDVASGFKEGDRIKSTFGGTAIVSSVDVSNKIVTVFHHNGNFGAVVGNNIKLASSSDATRGTQIRSITTVGGAPGFGTSFGNWRFNWFGRSVRNTDWFNLNFDRSTTSRVGMSTRTGVRQDLVLKTVNTLTGVKYVDVGVVPYIRQKDVHFDVKGLKPYTKMYPLFDSINVDEYCRQRNNTTEPWTFNTSPGLVTDKSGRLQGKFSIPGGKFKTGEKLFRLADVDLTDFTAEKPSVSSIADATYTASGTKRTKQSTFLSTKVPEVVNATLTDASNVRVVSYVDPLAQTFLVSNTDHASGVYITSIDLCFASKTTTDLPVWIELRSVVNGYPTNTVIPGTKVFKSPDEVALANSGNSYEMTTFTFDYPIYLQPGEYSFAVLSNSNDYEVYVAEMGRLDIKTGELISAQPYTGSMFKSQNGSTWTAVQEADLAFDIKRAVFETESSVEFYQNNTTLQQVSDFGYDGSAFNFDVGYSLMNFNTSSLLPGGTTIKWEYKTSTKTNGVIKTDDVWTEFIPADDIEFMEQKYIRGNSTSLRIKATLMSNDTSVSPLIDLTDQTMMLMENLINAPETNTNVFDPTLGEGASTGGYALAKHISKSVVLEDGMDAEDIKVYVEGSRRANNSVSNIKAFVRIKSKGDDNVDFYDRKWYPLVLVDDPGYSTTESDYKTYQYQLPKNIWFIERENTTTGIKTLDVYYTGDGRTIRFNDVDNYYEYNIEDMDKVLGSNDKVLEHVSYDAETEQMVYTYYNHLYESLESLETAALGSFIDFNEYATKIVMTSSNKALVPVINEIKTLALT